jgi:two-component system sensor histidine kinase CiaH
MFKEARIKLTVWYLAIIMAISLSFSLVIYLGLSSELGRFEQMQTLRQQRVGRINLFLQGQGIPPPEELGAIAAENIGNARLRMIEVLGSVNFAILVIAGLGGYFLAGRTLEPISEMMEAQKEFVSNASHELRTPLTSLKTEIEVALRDKKMTLSEAKILLKSNLEDINKMQRLSDYLIKSSRYGGEETELEFGQVDFGAAALKAVEKLESLATKKGIKIVKKIGKVEVVGNEDALVELATILIDNAVKYSGKSKTIEVKVKSRGTLEVRDFGVGISKVDLPHVFERFFRADTSRSKEKMDGYGLGLSIAKSIVDKHGGKIKVQSVVGKGSTFSVQLPFA